MKFYSEKKNKRLNEALSMKTDIRNLFFKIPAQTNTNFNSVYKYSVPLIRRKTAENSYIEFLGKSEISRLKQRINRAWKTAILSKRKL